MKANNLFILFTICLLNIGNSQAQVTSEYYKGSEIIFCEDVVNGNPVNPSTFFIINSDGGYVTVMVSNGKPIKTSKLIVQVWKMSKSGEYDESIESKQVEINQNSESPNFKYIFFKSGKYKLVIYSKEEEWINTGYVTIGN